MRRASGFTLIEVLVAIAIFTIASIGIAQLIGMATRAVRSSREHTTAVILAAAKMEQLRALDWTYRDAAGIAVERSDFTTNLSAEDLSNDGPGLIASLAETLGVSTPFFVDYLDRQGRWVGNGADPPPDALFVRRWAVRPLPADPSRTIVLQVLVTTVQQDRARAGPWRARSGSEAFLVSVRTRKR
jgi:prepilin-type N-terminal cleavage/methylation domain-containing protein